MSKEEALNILIKDGVNTNKISDGYHTFEELYEHRIMLFIALCKELDDTFKAPVWRSKKHSDGSAWDGWFLLGINKKSGQQITYHLPISKWDITDFAEELDKAPDFDGHTSGDVLNRISKL